MDLEYVTLYPAHAGVVANGRETIATYIKHRLERETQVLAVLRSSVPTELDPSSPVPSLESGAAIWSTWNIVRTLYKSYPESLWLPASRGIDLHLRKLEGEGFVRCMGGEGAEGQWRLTISPAASPVPSL
jgi:ribonuclease/clavin/mitogillin